MCVYVLVDVDSKEDIVYSVKHFVEPLANTITSSFVPPMFAQQWTQASAKSIWGAMIKY